MRSDTVAERDTVATETLFFKQAHVRRFLCESGGLFHMGYIEGDGRDQGTLFPVFLDDFVPADHISVPEIMTPVTVTVLATRTFSLPDGEATKRGPVLRRVAVGTTGHTFKFQ
jgi:hypothetical protein